LVDERGCSDVHRLGVGQANPNDDRAVQPIGRLSRLHQLPDACKQSIVGILAHCRDRQRASRLTRSGVNLYRERRRRRRAASSWSGNGSDRIHGPRVERSAGHGVKPGACIARMPGVRLKKRSRAEKSTALTPRFVTDDNKHYHPRGSRDRLRDSSAATSLAGPGRNLSPVIGTHHEQVHRGRG